jgi:hypothetical protein
MQQAREWMRAIELRKQAGLCSVKQRRWLRNQGLRHTDVSEWQARTIMSAARENGWRVPGHLRAEYGAKETA